MGNVAEANNENGLASNFEIIDAVIDMVAMEARKDFNSSKVSLTKGLIDSRFENFQDESDEIILNEFVQSPDDFKFSDRIRVIESLETGEEPIVVFDENFSASKGQFDYDLNVVIYFLYNLIYAFLGGSINICKIRRSPSCKSKGP